MLDAAGPGLGHFIREAGRGGAQPGGSIAEGQSEPPSGGAMRGKNVYVETYGCQMNVNDTEVVLSLLGDKGYSPIQDPTIADVILLNTCAIREKPENKIWSRLGEFKKLKAVAKKNKRRGPIVGVLGCMAERLKHKLLDADRLADIVVGPDAYRDMPRLLKIVEGEADGGAVGALNTQLSLDETYADVVPLRPAGAVTAFISIMRGCNNMCSFCIVPFTRGRERSRPTTSILDEIRLLSDTGVKEVTLLGQNVNSYADFATESQRGAPGTTVGDPFSTYAAGFRSVYKPKREGAVQFAELLQRAAEIDPEMRIRFTSPHPKDFSDDVLQVVQQYPNVCKQLHLPAQSGSSDVLDRMKRGYTREAFDALVDKARRLIPGLALSTDIITGFCGESEDEHAATLDLMSRVGFEQAFMFAYSQRDKTHAARHLEDDVPQPVKARRLAEVIQVFRETMFGKNEKEVGRTHLVLVEGEAKKSEEMLTGRTCTMKRVIFPKISVPASQHGCGGEAVPQPGDYVSVDVVSAQSSTLTARPLARTTLREFHSLHGSTVPRRS
ncbi:unnamed protein product [Ostreobium quekettii]|uniref:Uncharacterized protein n=1 Tax=Ostreobium quekettii TaxID=121088 RepID=A0A8S1J0M0_9CHLO|nr:unnamed protein product [Ostreobium quekettii]